MILYDVSIDGYHGEEYAVEYLRGMVWCEVHTTEQPQPRHSRAICTYDGVTLYYDFGADYYFYEDAI